MMMRRLFLSAAVLAVAGLSLVAVATFATHGSATVSAQGPTRTVELDDDWNLVRWTGGATPVEQALEAILSRVSSAHTFDNSSKQFRNFSPTGPAFVNSLQMFNPGDAVWIRNAATRVLAAAPRPRHDHRRAHLRIQPRALVRPGRDSGRGGRREHRRRAQRRLRLRPGQPDLRLLRAQSPGPAQQPHDAALRRRTLGAGHPQRHLVAARVRRWWGSGDPRLSQLGLTVEIPAGALPPGVSPDDIVARNARNSDSSFTQDGVPVRIDGWPVLSAVTLEPAGLEFLQPITVSLAVPDGPGGTPFALPLTNRIGDAVDDVRTDVAADGSAVVSWETTQAGTFAALEASIDFSASDIGSVAPGTPFSVDVTVDISGAIPTVDVGGESGVVPLAIEAATLSGTFTAPAGVTPPSLVAPAPTLVAFDPASSTVYSGNFICSTPGPFEIVYEFALDWAIQLILPAPFLPVTLESGTYRGSVVIAGTCS